MGFQTLHAELVAKCASVDTPRSRAMARVLAMPALMAATRACYGAAPAPLRPLVRTRVRALIEGLAEEAAVPQEEGELGRVMVHFSAQLRTQEHAADVDVRRWARIGTALHEDAEARALLASFADGSEERVRHLVRASLDWTVSECLRRGYPIVPP